VKANSLPHLTPNDRTAVSEYIECVQERFPDRVLAVTLFGSKARGDADAESDIDLLVLVDVESDEFRSELWHIASEVSLDYNVVISPRVFGQARWAETRRIRLPLYRAVEADGIPLMPDHLPVQACTSVSSLASAASWAM
jgi:predicted nucleotidyltransferase